MYLKIAANLISILLLAILQIGFISGLPAWLHYIDLCLVVPVLLLVIYDFKLAFYWALGLGILLDFFSFNYFGVNIFSLILTVILADLALVNFLTNRSLYSILALVVIAYAVWQILVIGSTVALDFLLRQSGSVIFDWNFFTVKFIGLAVNLFITACLFYFMIYFSNRFKPSILKSKI